ELAVYATALTSAQVSSHYAKGLNAALTTNFGYDQNGNEVSAGSRTFTYDLENRLASTTSGGATDAYAYDGNGNRLSETHSDTHANRKRSERPEQRDAIRGRAARPHRALQPAGAGIRPRQRPLHDARPAPGRGGRPATIALRVRERRSDAVHGSERRGTVCA